MSNPWFGAALAAGELEVVVAWAQQLGLEVVRNAPVQVWDPDAPRGVRVLYAVLHVLIPTDHPLRAECAAGLPGLAESRRAFKVAEVVTFGALIEMGCDWLRGNPLDGLRFSQTAALPAAPVAGMQPPGAE